MSHNSYGSPWRGVFGFLIVAGAVIGLLLGALAFFDVLNVFGAWMLNNIWLAWFMPGGLVSATPAFWLLIVFMALVIPTVVTWESSPTWQTPAWVLFVIVSIVTCVWSTILVSVHKVEYLTQNDTIQYVVDDIDKEPLSLEAVANSQSRSIGLVEANTSNEVPTEWTSREDTKARTNAESRLEKASDTMPRTELMPETVQLMFGSDEPAWTGVIDRTSSTKVSVNKRYIAGVGVYQQDGTVDTCTFDEGYELHRHFDGIMGTNLYNDIAQHDPRFIYSPDDVYGYCEDGKPVIAIPGTRAIAWHNQTVLEPYGLMTIRGSASGEPIIEIDQDIESGDYPGPVYPTSLVNQQRDALEWSIGMPVFNVDVGYQPAQSIIDDMGMDTNNLVQSSDGHMYWSTPMVPIGNDKSQLAIAISLIPADELKAGELNQYRVRVYNSDDPKVTDMSLIRGIVEDRIKAKESAFFSTSNEDNQGAITDMTLLSINEDGTTWQIIASSGDRPRYMVIVSGNTTLQAEIFELDELGNARTNGDSIDNSSISVDCNAPGATGVPDDALQCALDAMNAYEELTKEKEEPTE